MQSVCENVIFSSHLCIKAIFLPRQARDKPRENSKRCRFLRSLPTPKNWSAVATRTCERSAAKPDVWLQLEHVFGYNGPKNIQPNVFYTASGEVLYYTSAVGILYMPSENKQKFYLGHEDEISCLTLHPVRSAFYPHDKTINIATRPVCFASGHHYVPNIRF